LKTGIFLFKRFFYPQKIGFTIAVLGEI